MSGLRQFPLFSALQVIQSTSLHAKEVHGDKRVDFEMKVMKTFKGDPLGRQVYESILIIDSKNQDDFPMNSKNEFNQALIITASYKQRHSE